VREGVADGLTGTREYLLSHHEPADYDRCYAVPFRGRRVRLCARCSGIYPGIAAGVAAAYVAGLGGSLLLLVAAISPAFTLVDWARTAFTRATGSNPMRTATGALLGFGYGAAVVGFLTSFDLRLLGVAAVYGGLAAGLLAVERRSPPN
jgi:uncharacterized membrane protein